MKKTLYDILHIDNKASLEQIEAAYLAQKRMLMNAAEQESQNDLKLVHHSYLVLSDQRQRDKYDHSLKLQISRDNSLIYYSDEYADRSWPARFIFLIIIAAAVFFAFQHLNKSHVEYPSNQRDSKLSIPSSTAPTGYVVPPVNTQTSAAAPQHAIAPNSAEDWAIGNHAQIDDVDAVPILGGVGRNHYKEFLSHAGPRAFVICRDGSFSAIYGTNQYVTQQLRDRAGGCEPYAVNDVVVWRAR